MIGYTALARCYDRFVGADYSGIVDFIDKSLNTNLKDPKLICDIGCGSGTVVFELIKRGYDLIGIDGSVEMLSEAMQKRAVNENGDKALFLCQELPNFELYGTVDAIISTLDTFNYITEEKDLDRLFYWLNNYLNPDGLLIFDVNTFHKYDRILNNYSQIYDENELFMTWRSDFDGDLCRHFITVFEEEDGVFYRSDEEQIQRYYSPEKIARLLEKYNFDILGIYDDYRDYAPCETTQRLTYVAKVRKENV